MASIIIIYQTNQVVAMDSIRIQVKSAIALCKDKEFNMTQKM